MTSVSYQFVKTVATSLDKVGVSHDNATIVAVLDDASDVIRLNNLPSASVSAI